MKLNIRVLVILFTVSVAIGFNPKVSSGQQNNVNFQVFYDQLSPYGEWVDYQNYGYVWIPDVGKDFVPYSTSGYWTLTDYGWTWVSDYDWGWAPFHYGRWGFDNQYGWLWVPGTEWGPSWVNWRSADGYYGWSPMEPGISLSVSFGRQYDRNNDHWMFVRDRDFERHDLNRYSVNRNENFRIIGNSKMINTTYIDSRRTIYVTGPAREDVQRVVGRRINPIAIHENSHPGKDLNNGQLRIFKPQVERINNNQNKPVPGRVSNIKDLKRPSERSSSNSSDAAGTRSHNSVLPASVPAIIPGTTRKIQPAVQNGKNSPVNSQSTPPRTSAPANNIKVQPAVQHPQNSRANSQQAPQRNAIPPNNNLSKQPAVQNSKNSPVNSQPTTPQRTATPPQRNVTPPNNNVRQQHPVQSPQNRPANPRPESQPRTATPSNNNVRSQPAPQRPPNINNRASQPNNVRPQTGNPAGQPKEPRPEREK